MRTDGRMDGLNESGQARGVPRTNAPAAPPRAPATAPRTPAGPGPPRPPSPPAAPAPSARAGAPPPRPPRCAPSPRLCCVALVRLRECVYEVCMRPGTRSRRRRLIEACIHKQIVHTPATTDDAHAPSFSLLRPGGGGAPTPPRLDTADGATGGVGAATGAGTGGGSADSIVVAPADAIDGSSPASRRARSWAAGRPRACSSCIIAATASCETAAARRLPRPVRAVSWASGWAASSARAARDSSSSRRSSASSSVGFLNGRLGK